MRDAFVQCPACSYTSRNSNCAAEINSDCRRATREIAPLPGFAKECAYACSIADQMVKAINERGEELE